MFETGCKSQYYLHILEIKQYLQSTELAYTKRFC